MPLFSVAPAGLLAAALPPAYFLAPAGALTALVFALLFYRGFMRQDEGEPEMVRVAQAVREGAYAYLRRQRRVVVVVFIGLLALLSLLAFGPGLQETLTPLGVAVAGVLSGLCGYLGMKTATNASARTARAARDSLNDGLKVAFRAGAVMGLCVTGFALLDISVWLLVLGAGAGDDAAGLVPLTTLMLSFAMGASLQALFARVGGGIYTKAADVGADLVGKVEAGIPEDDARNPAAIADNVGDNVGDVAGMGADLYESYYGSILAAMALSAAAAVRIGLSGADAMMLVCVAPALAGLGILCSIASIYAVRAKENASFAQLLKGLHAGVYLSSGLIVAGSAGLLYWMLGGIDGVSWLGLWGAIVTGLIAGLVIAYGTEFYTSYEHGPTQRIAAQSETGSATVIISGIAEGMISTWVPLVTVVVAITAAFGLAGGRETFLLGVLGVAIAAVGMLSTLGITLATDAYGPIADNAGGNAEMTGQPAQVRERTDMLDSLGNTTAATGKGFAIGSAALTALALLAAFVITVQISMNRVITDPGIRGDGTPFARAGVGYQGRGIFSVIASSNDYVAGVTNAPRETLETLDALYAGAAEAGTLPMLVRGTWDPSGRVYTGEATGEGNTALTFQVRRANDLSIPELMHHFDVTLMNPRVLCGLFLGVMLVFVFCAMTMNAVGRAANAMMVECRRQFVKMKEGFRADGVSDEDIADPMKWPMQTTVDGHQYPDYANCVDISTGRSLSEMVVPSLLAVAVPLIVGLVLGVPGMMGLLAGTLMCGFAVAIFMANAGGAWDNAKKYIESGQHGGKGSDNHKATVVGDTVGDPFKDTSGPALNILIKLVSIVSVVFAAVIVKYSPVVMNALGLG